MPDGFARFHLDAIFSDVKTGDFHASSKLNLGETPLVSCKTEEHGVEGFFQIPEGKTYNRAVTIACDGTPLTSFYHPFRFAAKDNVLVCIPRDNIKLGTILYAVAYLNRERWRFSYGRKSYANKIERISIRFPVTKDGKIDEMKIETMLKDKQIEKFLPKRNDDKIEVKVSFRFKKVPITSIFDLESGDYHSVGMLQSGEIPLVSCGENDNGVVGHYSIPAGKIYENVITIAYNGQPLTTKFHPYKFGTKDDVAICTPKKPLKLSTITFLQYLINRQSWRYSYGRKCYKAKLEHLMLNVPVTGRDEIDEEAIEKIVSNTSYWTFLKKQVTAN